MAKSSIGKTKDLKDLQLSKWYSSWFDNDNTLTDQEIINMYKVWKKDGHIIIKCFNLPATTHTIISAFEELTEIMKDLKEGNHE